MRSSDGFRNWSILIPINIGAVTAALVILEGIGQHTAVGTDAEVIRRIGSQDDTTRHGEAVEVATDVAGGGGNALVIEVVARSERDVPLVGGLDAARNIHTMAEGEGIAHRTDVDILGAVFGNGIVPRHIERPWNLEGHISVEVLLGLLGNLLLRRFIRIVVSIVIIVILPLSVLVVLFRAEPLLEGLVVEGVRESVTHTLEASEAPV